MALPVQKRKEGVCVCVCVCVCGKTPKEPLAGGSAQEEFVQDAWCCAVT